MSMDKKALKVPRVIRGSVVVHRRRCGKPNCHCVDGIKLHESTVLSYSESGKTRFVMLPAEQVDKVTAAVRRYQAAKSALKEDGNAGLATLIASLSSDKSQSR